MRKVLLLTAIAILGSSGTVLAQSDGGNDPRCTRLERIVKSPPPTEGSLASLEHTVAVLKAAIGMIDQSCDGANPQDRASYYNAWKQVRAHCLQLTSGATTYADLDDKSPCKEEVSAN